MAGVGWRGFPFLFCQNTRAGALKIMQDWLIRCCEPLVDLCDVWMILIVLGPAVTDRLVSLCRQTPVGGRQIHDANIVATMLAYGERRLLTFNMADFRRYADRIELVAG